MLFRELFAEYHASPEYADDSVAAYHRFCEDRILSCDGVDIEIVAGCFTEGLADQCLLRRPFEKTLLFDDTEIEKAAEADEQPHG